MDPRDQLIAQLSELQTADDDRWTDQVMGLVDDLAHRAASDSVNQGADYDAAHDGADMTRAELHNSAPETVADWLIDQLGVDGALAELAATHP
jgi:hypothetical protein